MLPYKKLITFNEFKNLSEEDYKLAQIDPLSTIDPQIVEKDEDDIMHLIFAPDPLTGMPRSDLAVIMSKDSAPEVAKYIQDTLLRPVVTEGPSGTMDADEALDAMRNHGESFETYANRIRELAQKSFKKKDSE